jgi:hypothetical protein
MARWEFPSSDPIDLHVNTVSGSVAIIVAEGGVVTVAAHRTRHESPERFASQDDDFTPDLDVRFTDGRLDIEQPKPRGLHLRSMDIHLLIAVPAQSHCTVRTASASVSCDSDPASLDVRTASGKVEAATVHGPVRVNTASGKIRIDRAEGEAHLNTASGQMQLRYAGGDVTVGSASGEVGIGTAEGSVQVGSASGRVRVGSVARGRTDVNTVSGDVEIKVAPGTGVYLDLGSLTGRVSSELAPSELDAQDANADLHLHCRTVSGSLRIARAASAEMAS